MAEKKKAKAKKTTSKVEKEVEKKTATKKTSTAKTKKESAKKENKKETKKDAKKAPVKKEVVKEEVKVAKEPKVKKAKKECKLIKWFNNLTLDQIIIGGVVIIALLLIVLIFVSTKNTKTTNGDDIVVKVDGKVVTANDLYDELKEKNGYSVAIDLVDNYLLEKEYKTTDEMKESAKATIETYKSTYGENYEAFLEYNGIKNDKELKEILIKNNKLSMVTENYIKENITEKQMKKYYEESIYGDISAKHILIKADYEEGATEDEIKASEEAAKKEAESLIERIKNGEEFDVLAKEYSDDEASKESGGDLGYFNTGDMVKEFEEAAYNLDVNEYTTEPVKTTYGYHIIMKTGSKEKPSYKKAKDTIIEKLIEEKKSEDAYISVKAMIALREKYNIKIKDKTVKSDYESYIKESNTATTTTTESE